MIAYYSAVGPHLDPKKLPKTIDEFMRIGDKPKKSRVSDEMRELYKRRMDEYNEGDEGLQGEAQGSGHR